MILKIQKYIFPRQKILIRYFIIKLGTKEVSATGITERGSICQFNMTFGVWFEPGAGIVPTHGGFLMCGKNANSATPNVGKFLVSFITLI